MTCEGCGELHLERMLCVAGTFSLLWICIALNALGWDPKLPPLYK